MAACADASCLGAGEVTAEAPEEADKQLAEGSCAGTGSDLCW